MSSSSICHNTMKRCAILTLKYLKCILKKCIANMDEIVFCKLYVVLICIYFHKRHKCFDYSYRKCISFGSPLYYLQEY